MLKFPASAVIDIDNEIYEQLCNEKNIFEHEAPKSDSQFDKSNQIQYYLISTKFLAEWQNMVNLATGGSAPAGNKKSVKTPDPMNMELVEQHLTDFDEYILKRQVQEGKDYKFYNYSVMSIFSKYQGAVLPRKAYYSGVQKKIELYPIKFQFIYMSRSWYDLIKKNQDLQIPVLTSIGYKNQTILDLLYRLVEYSKKDKRNRNEDYNNNAAAKLYFGFAFDPVFYASMLRVKKQDEPQNQNKKEIEYLQHPGNEVNSNKLIGDLQIPNHANYLLIVELQEDKWLYNVAIQSQNQRCQFCRQTRKLPFQCKCKEVRYCCIQCKQKDWKWHARTCQAQYQEDNLEPKFEIKESSKLGLVGLSNLGNTCYMNAALQCMIHTKDLTEYFRQKFYLSEINQKNPIGSKGKLIKAYAKFIQSVLVSEQQVVIPSRLKHIIGKQKQMFSGFQQHDSQQFLLFMLDTLHQDLNRVIEKPFTNGVQNEGRPDYIVAKQSWITYLKRNQSFINDLMGGQYRSQVKCPDCHNISVTFDPYLIFAVPIPSCQAKQINLYYFYSNFKNETLKITLSSKNNVVKQLREDLAAKTKSPVDQILLIVSGFNGSVRKVDDTETVDRLINQKQLNQGSQEKQLFAMQYQPHQLEDFQNKKLLIFKFVTKSGKTLTFKKPLPFNVTKKIKGVQLYDRVCQFTLSLWAKADKMDEKERETKLKVLKTKSKEQELFKIYLVYGGPTQVKNKLVYEKRQLIQEETNVSEILAKNKYQVEFQVEYAEEPSYMFNSFKSHYEGGSSYLFDGPKLGSSQSYTLYQCLDQMKKSQKLLQGNQVFCSVCHDLKLAEKKMQMYKASKYIILQLRRFKQIGYEKSKNYAQIKFPMDLDLSNYILSPKIPETYFIDDEQFFKKPKYWKGYDTSDQRKYKLYGVVNHHGSLNGGHYTAFGSHLGKWYKFDDRDVTEVEPEKVVTSDAYLLFYERA